jgi:hypothetical protein
MQKIRSLVLPLFLGLLSGIILVVACGVESTSQAQAGGSAGRSAVAGTWSMALPFNGGNYACTLHLAGSDAALTGAAVCNGGIAAGELTGDLFNKRLRLNIAVTNAYGGTADLVDASVANAGTSATGTMMYPGFTAGIPITMTVQ